MYILVCRFGLYSQFLTVYARSSSAGTSGITPLNHKVLFFFKKKGVSRCERGRSYIYAHGYDSMKNDAVVVSLFREFCKVFARLATLFGLVEQPSGNMVLTYFRGVVPVEFDLDNSQVCLEYDGF